MANLSAHIDFTVSLNFKTKVIGITGVELSALPVGIGGLTMSAKVMQPDCVNGSMPVSVTTVYPLSFSGSRSLRMDVAGLPQTGVYKVVLTVKAPGYDDTVITKTVVLNYRKPTVKISKNFNVLTPLLKVKDQTLYTSPDLTADTVTRAWEVEIGSAGSLTFGNVVEPTLSINDDFYDAKHAVSLVSQVTFESISYPFLTVIDELSGSAIFSSYQVPAFSAFPDILEEIAVLSGGAPGCGCGPDSCESHEYKKAYLLFRKIELTICKEITADLLQSVDEFLNIYWRLKGVPYVNTDTVIAAYDRSFCDVVPPDNPGGNYIENRTTPQPNANINIDGGATFGDIPEAETIIGGDTPFSIPLEYLVAIDGRVMHLTEEQMAERFGGGNNHTHTIGQITGLVDALNSFVVKNAPITSATKTKITYDEDGLVTAGADLVEADIPELSQAKITGLVAALNAKSNVGHIHSITEISGLTGILLGKLDTGLAVLLTGNQAVNGVKTFALSPIVPLPVNPTQVANKQYVDGILAGITENKPYKVTLAATGTYDVPVGLVLTGIIITPSATMTIKVGTAAGGDDIMIEQELTGGEDKDILIFMSCRAGKTLHFTGISASTEILIYTRTLTPVNP